MEISQIDTSTKEGRALMAALAIITTESRKHQTPYEVLHDIDELAGGMFPGSHAPMMEFSDRPTYKS